MPLSFPRGGKLSARNELTDEGLTKIVDFSPASDKKSKSSHPSSVNGFAVATFPPTGEGLQDNNLSPSPRTAALKLPPWGEAVGEERAD